MAKQVGDHKFLGRIKGLTGYQDSDGEYCVRSSTGVDGDKVKYGAEFERTRENNAEFTTAQHAASLFWKAFKAEKAIVSDGKNNGRLTGKFVLSVKTDCVRPRAHRRMEDCNLSHLLGFEFNNKKYLEEALPIPISTRIDRSTGIFAVDVLPFIPAKQIERFNYASHFKLVATAAEIDFVKGTYTTRSVSSSYIPLKLKEKLSLTFVNTLPDCKGHLFLVLSIQFFRKHRREMEPLKTFEFNAASIVGVLAADQSIGVITDPDFPETKVVQPSVSLENIAHSKTKSRKRFRLTKTISWEQSCMEHSERNVGSNLGL